jgi:hypothetical protein
MLKICNGLRPTIVDDEGTPECWIDLMQRCWDPDPSKRPTASEAHRIIRDWWSILEGRRDDHDGIRQQFTKADAYRKQRPQLRRQEQHPGARYSSRFVPHITDKVITAYAQSQHSNLEIEQEDLAAEVSVNLQYSSFARTHYMFTCSNVCYKTACNAHLGNTVSLFILGTAFFSQNY